MKRFLIVTALVLALVLAFGGTAMAGEREPTDVTVRWDGSGFVGSTVIGGGTAGTDNLATVNFSTNAFNTEGTFKANYQVLDPASNAATGSSHFTTSIDSKISGGGYIEYVIDRGTLGTAAPGDSDPHPGGNRSYSFIEAHGSGSSAILATRSRTSAMLNQNNGHSRGLIDQTRTFVSQYTVGGLIGYKVNNAESFAIERLLLAADGDTFAKIEAWGVGDAGLYNIASVADTNSAYCGGHPDAQEWHTHRQAFEANNGLGQLMIAGRGSNSVTLSSLNLAGSAPVGSSFASTGILSVVDQGIGYGLRATGTGDLGSSSILQIAAWNSSEYGEFKYNNTPIQAW